MTRADTKNLEELLDLLKEIALGSRTGEKRVGTTTRGKAMAQMKSRRDWLDRLEDLLVKRGQAADDYYTASEELLGEIIAFLRDLAEKEKGFDEDEDDDWNEDDGWDEDDG